MADNASQIQYRQEYIAGFEQQQSLLRDATTTEAVFKGNQATFLVADSGSATAVTRGVNGNIPARADNNTQLTATLVEKHDLVRKTGFNIFESQGDQRRIMQVTSMGVINRDIDSEILTALEAGTVTLTAAIASLTFVTHAKTKLGNAEVPFDGNLCAVISPAFEAYLLQVKEFGNADYVTRKPVDSGETGWDDTPGYYQWLGVKWIVHPNISGVGTSAEKCFMFHKNAIGHAANVGEMESLIGYDEEQAYSWARCSIFKGSKMLQDSGIVEMTHDGSALA
jgi:hypothetical protein